MGVSGVSATSTSIEVGPGMIWPASMAAAATAARLAGSARCRGMMGCAAPDGLLVFVDFAFVFAIVLSPAALRGAGLAAPRFPPPVFVRTRTACISTHERVQQVQRGTGRFRRCLTPVLARLNVPRQCYVTM